MDLKTLIGQYLTSNNYVQLATVKDGQPWICTVHFVADENFNIYWSSSPTSRHSTEILADSKAAATVVHNTDNRQAIQMAGNAYKVEEADMERVHELYSAKFGARDMGAYWVFKPSEISLFDPINFPGAPKQHYKQS